VHIAAACGSDYFAGLMYMNYVLEQKHGACRIECAAIFSLTNNLLDFMNELCSLRGVHLNKYPKENMRRWQWLYTKFGY
jgi:hypothetical protein